MIVIGGTAVVGFVILIVWMMMVGFLGTFAAAAVFVVVVIRNGHQSLRHRPTKINGLKGWHLWLCLLLACLFSS